MKQKKTVVVVAILVLLLGGGIMFKNQTDQSAMEKTPGETTMAEKTASSSEGSKEDKKVMSTAGNNAGAVMNSSYTGKVLAGTSSPYLEFNQKDYEMAQKSGKTIFLDFYANWCPICRAEAPDLQAGFNTLKSDQVVGFRVNWQDDQTDENEKRLSSEFKVPAQHTKIILKNGKEVLRTSESWDKEMFAQEIAAIL
ncbi:MAG: thioredoxin family protein [Patescibacteria group bacterium]